ncbi:hypothetical protein [Collimonas sp. PA-H2]|uniref:hypothetical protein n=1 Tax=Collimonas sp. PA-H2 TaxID=1881062 RepID=UPI00117E7089|nr:hypothetical protein [Collimonas sp. PA-H2]
MKSGVFVHKGNGGLGMCSPILDNASSTLITYREHSGEICFFSSEPGERVLNSILLNGSIADKSGNIITYENPADSRAFLSRISAFGGICFHQTNSAFALAAREMS